MSFRFIKKKLVHSFQHLQPTCCMFCQQRQTQPICYSCLTDLQKSLNYRQCLICGKPNLTWVCKDCKHASWCFDQTVALANETSRLMSTVKAFHYHGHFSQLASIRYVWKMIMYKKITPVDLIIPFPEDIKISQERGYWSALELTKKWSELTKTPFMSNLLIYASKESNMPMYSIFYTFKINTELLSTFSITNFRIAVILPHMQKPHLLHQTAQLLKAHGARSVINWVLIRDCSKERD